MNTNRKNITNKIALTVGILLLVVWSILGTGASLAWFKDETPAIENVFNFAKFDLDVQYKNSDMSEYEPLQMETNVFPDDALYEPGYTQVVYLKIKNNGGIDMKYKLAVDVRSVTTATSVLGNEIYLPNYLKYGVVFADSETMLDREISQQSAVRDMAELKLNSFTEYDSVIVAPTKERYAALIVYMPTTVGNVANYQGTTAPDVNMGLTIYAEQVKS